MSGTETALPVAENLQGLSFTDGDDCAGFLAGLFADQGNEHYGEGVSQIEHALQTAMHLDRLGADPATVVAGLLHDVGHLLHADGLYHAEHGIDAVHETVGADFLARHFGPEVTEPVRLHVDAKRYLCAVQPGYRATLSPASELSLTLQGGPMTASEVRDFEASPYCNAALSLRRCDEAAKTPGLATPDFNHYTTLIAGLYRRCNA